MLRLAFAGTPEISATVLRALCEKTDHSIELVLTQPDRPAGRGRKLTASPVKQFALEQNLQVLQPSKAEINDLEKQLSNLDLMVVVAYGMILPENILQAPRYGCFNIHTSLLPKWRGAAPIQRAIQAGDDETGVTIMQMDAGLDTGDILLQGACPIEKTDTSGDLLEKLANIGSECLLNTLDMLTSNELKPEPQDNSQSSYAGKITKAEAMIDWSQDASKIDCMIRAFNPAPVCHTELGGMPLRIWGAEVLEDDTPGTTERIIPGTIINANKSGIDIACGKGLIRILELQPQGKRAMAVSDFMNGNPSFGAVNS